MRMRVAPKPLLRALAVAEELLFFLLQSHERARLDGNQLRLAQDLRQVALFTVDQTSLPPPLSSAARFGQGTAKSAAKGARASTHLGQHFLESARLGVTRAAHAHAAPRRAKRGQERWYMITERRSPDITQLGGLAHW